VIVNLVVNVSEVPLWDGETNDHLGRLLNRFGGNPLSGIHATIQHVSDIKHTGAGAFRVDTSQAIQPDNFDFVGISLTGFGPSKQYVDTRDLTGFEKLRFWLRNDTNSHFKLNFEIKDYRDSNDHRVRCAYAVGSDASWTQITVPLDSLNNATHCVISGDPDLARTKLLLWVVEQPDAALNGPLFHLDNLVLVERGEPLFAQTAPVEALIERLAKRQFRGLWGARDQATGLVPTVSPYADISGINTTAALVELLPTAIAQSWITKAEADDYVKKVVSALNTAMDNITAQGWGCGYVPPRYLDKVTLLSSQDGEESSVDAAFVFLALYQYRLLLNNADFLRFDIENLLRRFNFAGFNAINGWNLACRYRTGLTPGVYDGYSGEIWLISLAAHLNRQVDIKTHWNSGVYRVKDYLVDPERSHVVHQFKEFRAPFLQWLFPLFVNVADRGTDTYPDRAVATNPYQNAVLYQLETHGCLARLGRGLLLQPDAGDDGTGQAYNQYSCYKDFDRPDLFMPWSVSFSFLADPLRAGRALRNHLLYGLHGPLGLTDAARWTTGESQPYMITALNDLWNTSLSTMALMQYRFGINRLLTSQPEVQAALDQVFLP
jgi:hypothetical protein